jgi:hypothetical protein
VIISFIGISESTPTPLAVGLIVVCAMLTMGVCLSAGASPLDEFFAWSRAGLRVDR